jgi:hypothetical protein
MKMLLTLTMACGVISLTCAGDRLGVNAFSDLGTNNSRDGGKEDRIGDIGLAPYDGLTPCGPSEIFCGSVCTNTHLDPHNCGRCDYSCAAGQTCGGGLCQCPPGLTNCSGVCVDLLNDLYNCGACDRSCGFYGAGSGPVPCVQGGCEYP